MADFELRLHEILSGRERSFVAALIRSGFLQLSWLYSAGMTLRNLAYRLHILPIYRVSVPVISLGNITTGGTGKTPLAAWISHWLLNAGCKPGLISRGYRSIETQSSGSQSMSSSPAANDEKLVLDRLCPNVPHLQQQDRVASARRAIAEFACDSLILDDGFQHRRLHRDLDLVLIDALQPWGYGYVLPRGLLREKLSGLRRADLLLITRANQLSEIDRLILRATLIETRGTDQCVELAFEPSRLFDLNGDVHALDQAREKKAYAFCGIGNPQGFRRTVEAVGATCIHLQPFADHHEYTPEELTELGASANKAGAEVVFTTLKDLVKISPDSWAGPPLFAIDIDVRFLKGRELLEDKLRQVVARVRRQ